jgi:hypothetical protein
MKTVNFRNISHHNKKRTNRVADFTHALDETLQTQNLFLYQVFMFIFAVYLHLQRHVCYRRVQKCVHRDCANHEFDFYFAKDTIFLPMEMLKFSAHSACSALPLVVAFLVSKALGDK